ncbi:MAG TPA: glutamine--fructose-6-phosphate aminotransferase, partial [Solirubrobacterales bacterium]|nr:glutamine--fructose-6-phosphate aminotransferase [Solirubrobacterales bacterium]
MCGIIGYVGNRPAEEILVAGLQKLEYRGYDSAGVAILAPEEGVKKVRAVGNLDGLRSALQQTDLSSTDEADAEGHFTGIAHTRWATHGRVTEANAHPHGDESGNV